jgi:hypothetical protein
MKPLQGIVHGKTIELAGNPGLPEGEVVEIYVRAIAGRPANEREHPLSPRLPGPPAEWYPGSQETAAGMLSATWSENDDRIFEQISRDRQDSAFREVEERAFCSTQTLCRTI